MVRRLKLKLANGAGGEELNLPFFRRPPGATFLRTVACYDSWNPSYISSTTYDFGSRPLALRSCTHRRRGVNFRSSSQPLDHYRGSDDDLWHEISRYRQPTGASIGTQWNRPAPCAHRRVQDDLARGCLVDKLARRRLVASQHERPALF